MQITDLLKLNYYQPIKSSNNIVNDSSNGSSIQTSNSNEQNINSSFSSAMTTVPTLRLRIPTEDTIFLGATVGGISLELSYSENSTDENPTMTARGWDENDDEFEQTININDIDPRNATIVEIKALQAHLKGGKLYPTGADSIMWNRGLGGKDIAPAGLNDKNDYITPLKQNIELYSRSNYPLSQEITLELSIILDRLSAFMNNEKIDNANK